MAAPAIQVVGAAELRLALGRLGDKADDPDVGERAAELVAGEARERVPVATGTLQGTIAVERALPYALVVAGSSAVPYAGVHEYGWATRGIEARHYLEDAASDQADEVTKVYADHVGGLVVDVGRTTPP